MNVLERFGKTALDAASSTLNYITPKVIKNKLRAFTNWLYDYVGPSDIDAVLNDTKDYIQSTYHDLKEFNFGDDLFRKDNASLVGNFILKIVSNRYIRKYYTYQDDYEVIVHSKALGSLSLHDLFLLFEQLVKCAKKQYQLDGNDLFRIVIEHERLHQSKPISTQRFPIKDFDFTELIKILDYEEIPLTECTITTEVIKVLRGAGRLQVTRNNLTQKRSVIRIRIAIPCA